MQREFLKIVILGTNNSTNTQYVERILNENENTFISTGPLLSEKECMRS